MGGPVIYIREITVHAPRGADWLTRLLLVVLTLAVAWQVVQPHLAPAHAEAGREMVTVNLERIGGRHVTNGIIPVQCADMRR
jgi:hypothetical protein